MSSNAACEIVRIGGGAFVVLLDAFGCLYVLSSLVDALELVLFACSASLYDIVCGDWYIVFVVLVCSCFCTCFVLLVLFWLVDRVALVGVVGRDVDAYRTFDSS